MNSICARPESILEDSSLKPLPTVVNEKQQELAGFRSRKFRQSNLISVNRELRFKLNNNSHNFNSIVKLLPRMGLLRKPNRFISQTVGDDDPTRFVR